MGSWCVWFCFPLYFLVLRLFSGFQHIYGQWVPGVLVLRTVFRFYGLVSGFGFGVSAYLRLMRSWILFYGLFSALFSAFTALVSWFQLVTGMLDLVSIFRF